MITLDGITRKVGADTLTWLWPWKRKGKPDHKYRSTHYERRFKDLADYKGWVGNIRWGLAENRIMGFSLLNLLRDYVTEVNPGRPTVVILDHGTELHEETEATLGHAKYEVLEDYNNIILDFNTLDEGYEFMTSYRALPTGIAVLIDGGRIVTTSGYLRATKPYINAERLLDLA